MPWLYAELDVVKPEALVLLGATAATALMGPGFRLTRARGRAIESDLAELVIATVHPAAILRAGDNEAREAARREFARDLEIVAEFLQVA
jgi:DNA polymerase